MSVFSVVGSIWAVLLGCAGLLFAIARITPDEFSSNMSKWRASVAKHRARLMCWSVVSLIVLFASGIGFGLGALFRPTLPWPLKQANAENPLRDDATKWWMAYSLFLYPPVPNAICEVTIVHYQVPYSEDLAAELIKVMTILRWRSSETSTSERLPKGISLKASHGSPAYQCAASLSKTLGSVGLGPANVTETQDNPLAQRFEVEIGNEPQ
jgi:hypothetical protein